MNITHKQLENLADALRGEPVQRAPASDNPNQCYDPGAVWYGDWLHYADQGRFGTKEKLQHNACITRRLKTASFVLAPITSERKKGDGVVEILPGTIPGGRFSKSYILTKWRLIISRRNLDKHFKYKCSLVQEVVDRVMEAMKR